MWRGPMLHKALQQFLTDVHWDEPDYLLVDLPPGTGDVSISIAQFLPGRQHGHRHDTAGGRREGRAARRVSWPRRPASRSPASSRTCPTSAATTTRSTRSSARAGVRRSPTRSGVPLLGEIPIDPKLREFADVGAPIVLQAPDSEVAQALDTRSQGARQPAPAEAEGDQAHLAAADPDDRRPEDTSTRAGITHHVTSTRTVGDGDGRRVTRSDLVDRSAVSVDAVGAEERAASLATRSIKKDSKLWALDAGDPMLRPHHARGLGHARARSGSSHQRRCARSPTDPSIPHVAALCIYPRLVAGRGRGARRLRRRRWPRLRPAFPSGQSSLEVRLQEIERAVADGADEIDTVISRGAFLAGDDETVFDEIVASQGGVRVTRT